MRYLPTTSSIPQDLGEPLPLPVAKPAVSAEPELMTVVESIAQSWSFDSDAIAPALSSWCSSLQTHCPPCAMPPVSMPGLYLLPAGTG